jgi:septum formation protein
MGGREAPLILASGSPRRKALLEALGYPLRLVPPEVEEDLDLPPRELAQAVARRKGERVEGQWVLAADTVVDLEGEALGKPRDREENRLFLRRLSGGPTWSTPPSTSARLWTWWRRCTPPAFTSAR